MSEDFIVFRVIVNYKAYFVMNAITIMKNGSFAIITVITREKQVLIITAEVDFKEAITAKFITDFVWDFRAFIIIVIIIIIAATATVTTTIIIIIIITKVIKDYVEWLQNYYQDFRYQGLFLNAHASLDEQDFFQKLILDLLHFYFPLDVNVSKLNHQLIKAFIIFLIKKNLKIYLKIKNI